MVSCQQDCEDQLSLKADGSCHESMNNAACNYDNGDCCLEGLNILSGCDTCFTCLCHETGSAHCLESINSSGIPKHDHAFCVKNNAI